MHETTTQGKTLPYTARLDTVESPLESPEQLRTLLRAVRDTGVAEFWLLRDGKPYGRFEGFLYRILGVSPKRISGGACLLKQGDTAALTFVDEDWHEYRVLNDGHLVGAPSVEFPLAAGGVATHPCEELLTIDVATRAMLEHYETGLRPSWLRYRFVR